MSLSSIVVATPEPRCPASLALYQEGVDFQEHLCLGPFDYGELFYELWNGGEFVLCEWDVIPAPGVVRSLLRCPAARCTHRYHLQPGHLGLGFGIGKYQPLGPPLKEWKETRWDRLDGSVVPFLNDRLGEPHVHGPPLAHVRRESVANVFA